MNKIAIKSFTMLTFVVLVISIGHTEMFLDSNGNIGIGTDSPAYTLSVNGTIETKAGGIKFPDGTIQSTAAAGSVIGDISSVNAGTGLNGGGTSGDVTLNVNTELIQSRVSGSCLTNQAIRAINSDGTVTCENVASENGEITSVNAGPGLSGGGTSGNVTLNADFAGTGSASTVSRSDHNHDSMYQQKYSGVAVVAQSGGDYADPLTAMNEINTWCSTPSPTNPCLLKIMPGIYDIGANSLQMQEYVDIAGSGEHVTKITGNISSSTNWWTGVVNGADFSEIRFITVENTGDPGGGYYGIAMALDGTSPTLKNVTVIASGASGENVSITCRTFSTSRITNFTAIATGGSVLALGFYMADCSPLITNAKITASASSRNISIDMDNASPTISNVTATAKGGSITEAVHVKRYAAPTLSNVRITASGGTDHNWGIYIASAGTPTLINVISDAFDGPANYGIYYYGWETGYTGGDLIIDHSVIKGTTGAIYIYDPSNSYFTRIGNTRLHGSVAGDGTHKCAGVYDENYTFYANTCP
jgi:hypothetical protein